MPIENDEEPAQTVIDARLILQEIQSYARRVLLNPQRCASLAGIGVPRRKPEQGWGSLNTPT
jgi:hypothetical protein